MNDRSFVIPICNKQIVIDQVNKLNRRARKLGVSEITISWGNSFLEKRKIKNSFHDVVVINVTINGPLNVSYDGWSFVATLQHLPTGENIIRSISDVNIPSEFHNSGSVCQHCKVNRYRKDTYLVNHEDYGMMQVGSSCIKDFLGGHSPDDLLKKATLASDIIDFMKGASNGGTLASEEGIYDITGFLAQTIAVIRDHGWVSKAEAKDKGIISTATRVQDNYNPPDNFPFTFSIVTNDDIEKAKLICEWVEDLSDNECEKSDYLHNIRAIVRSGMVGIRTIGFAVSIIAAYDKANSKPKLKSKLISSHIGKIKMRDEFVLTLSRLFEGESTYGHYMKYIFHDDHGNVFVWMTSNQSLDLNNKYCIRGTIKDHTEFNGVKQTVLTRCEILSEYEN